MLADKFTNVQGRLKTGQLIVRFSVIFLTGQIAKNRTPGNPTCTVTMAVSVYCTSYCIANTLHSITHCSKKWRRKLLYNTPKHTRGRQ